MFGELLVLAASDHRRVSVDPDPHDVIIPQDDALRLPVARLRARVSGRAV
jgi:hypothetical protein